jgi:hypothetical protein
MATWAEQLGESPTPWREQAYRSFNACFWFAEGGHLYDVIDGEHGDDTSLRPN